MEEQSAELSIGQVAERTGLSVHTLRYYEREGVLAGAGTEPERLELLRRQEQRIDEQREQLDRCRDLITFKIGGYEDVLASNVP